MQKNRPEIRFEGFDDGWEQRKLGDIFKYEQPQAYIVESTEYDDKNDIPVLTAGQSFILGYTDERFGIKEANEENPVIIFDDFTTSSHYVDFPFKIKSSAMKLLTLNNPKDDIHCTFNVLQNIGYVPVSHERHWISTFAKFNVLLPKSSSEQKQIGSYFRNLDNLITLHQRKCDRLQALKKAMLEKMFPKAGSDVPEIRFAGFTDAWEQRKLGDLVDVCSGRDYKHLSEGDIPVYGTGGYMLSVSEALSYDKDAIGIGRKGTIDKPYILNAPFWTVDTLFYAIPREKIDLNFAFDIFQNIDWKKKDESTGVPSLSKAAINEIDVLVPQYDEQQALGEFFNGIDNLITLHQRKLQKLQECKKALLEKMFVG